MKFRLMKVMYNEALNVLTLDINGRKYVTGEDAKSSLISKLVAGEEAFSFDYLASYCKETQAKKNASEVFADQYMVRCTALDEEQIVVA